MKSHIYLDFEEYKKSNNPKKKYSSDMYTLQHGEQNFEAICLSIQKKKFDNYESFKKYIQYKLKYDNTLNRNVMTNQMNRMIINNEKDNLEIYLNFNEKGNYFLRIVRGEYEIEIIPKLHIWMVKWGKKYFKDYEKSGPINYDNYDSFYDIYKTLKYEMNHS